MRKSGYLAPWRYYKGRIPAVNVFSKEQQLSVYVAYQVSGQTKEQELDGKTSKDLF